MLVDSRAHQRNLTSEKRRDHRRCVSVRSMNRTSIGQRDTHRRKFVRHGRIVVTRAELEHVGPLFCRYDAAVGLAQRPRTVADDAFVSHLDLAQVLTEHGFDRVTEKLLHTSNLLSAHGSSLSKPG